MNYIIVYNVLIISLYKKSNQIISAGDTDEEYRWGLEKGVYGGYQIFSCNDVLWIHFIIV